MKTALVTGASRGIGRAIAEKLKKLGYNTVINFYSSKNEAEALSENGFFCVQADVSDMAQVEKMFAEIHKKLGRVDLLVNNAGIALKQKVFLDVSQEEFDRLFAVDVKGVFNCSKLAVNDMLSVGHGKIINIASIWGDEGAACEACYSAAKGAVIAFTKSLAKELEGSVEVNAVLPGFVDTDMNAHLTNQDKLDFMRSQGLKSLSTTEDIALAVEKLVLSNDTGKLVKVYGEHE